MLKSTVFSMVTRLYHTRPHVLQAAAEESAAVSAKEGLEKRAREAESQAQALADTVEQLRLTLNRQRASTELRYS